MEGGYGVGVQGETAAAGDDQTGPAGQVLSRLPLPVPEVALPVGGEDGGDGPLFSQ